MKAQPARTDPTRGRYLRSPVAAGEPAAAREDEALPQRATHVRIDDHAEPATGLSPGPCLLRVRVSQKRAPVLFGLSPGLRRPTFGVSPFSCCAAAGQHCVLPHL